MGKTGAAKVGWSEVFTGPSGLRVIAFILIVFLLLRAMILGLAGGLLDPDYFWHLRTGQWIFENAEIPRADIFSYTAGGEPWVPHEWLFQLLLYLTFKLGGESLIMFLTALLGGCALFLAFLSADRWIKSPVLSLILTLAMTSTYVIYVIPRPHLFSFLFFMVMFRWLWAARYDGRLRGLFFLPLLMILWVNLHGGYFIALSVLLAFTLLEWLRNFLAAAPLPRRYLNALAVSALLSIMAAGVNPEGPAHLLYPLYVMGQSANSFIAEWGSPNFHEPMAKWFLLAVLLFVALLACRRERPDLTELVIPLTTMAAGFTALRHTPFAVLLMISYAGQAVGMGALEPLRQCLARFRGESAAGWSDRQLSPKLEKLLGLSITAFLLVGIIVSVFDFGYAERRKEFLAGAVGFIRENPLEGPMLNQYGLGGLLIYHLFPDRKVYIDGRADLYGDERVKAYSDMVALKPGWHDTFEAGEFGFVVLSKQVPLAGYLSQDPDYALAFEEKDAQVFLKRLPVHQALIEAYEEMEASAQPDPKADAASGPGTEP